MDRLPFNPDDITGPPPDSEIGRRERKRHQNNADARELTVTQVGELISQTLEERFASPLRVVGEVSNLNGRKHWYFSLKDEESVLSCVAWASAVKRFKFHPSNGQEIVAIGHIAHFAAQGRTQLYVRAIEPVGEGALDQRFRALCEKLRALGYFDEHRKRPLPLLPRRIAVITSRTSAAIEDVRSTVRHRCAAVGLIVVDVRVQGAGAADGIAAAIRHVNRVRAATGIDAIVVTRGGGSIEDLWAFNEHQVADAVFESELPVIAAIGHESDTTVIELVADLRAATPTQAIMHLVPDAMELERQLTHLGSRMRTLLLRYVKQGSIRLDGLARNELLRSPQLHLRRTRDRFGQECTRHRRCLHDRIARERVKVANAALTLERIRPEEFSAAQREHLAVVHDRLRRAVRFRFHHERERAKLYSRAIIASMSRFVSLKRYALLHAAATLHAVDVQSVLRRGFSYTTNGPRELVRSIRDAESGDHLLTHLADGTIRSTVSVSIRRKSRPARNESNEDQLELFEASGD